VRQLAVDYVQVGAAYAARRNLHQDLTLLGLRRWPLPHDERRACLLQHHCPHDRPDLIEGYHCGNPHYEANLITANFISHVGACSHVVASGTVFNA
jgi:hypothetical protein